MANNAAKAPSSAQPPLSLRTIIRAAAINAFAKVSKEWLTMPRHSHLCRYHSHHCAPLFAQLPLLPSRKRARNSQQCQGTIVHTIAVFCHSAPLFTPLLSLRLHVKAKNGQQCQGTIIHKAATLVVVHRCLCRCRHCHRTRGQGTADNAKALLFAPLPFIHADVVIAVVQEGKEWPTMPRPIVHIVVAF
jgi:hypothetical protein